MRNQAHLRQPHSLQNYWEDKDLGDSSALDSDFERRVAKILYAIQGRVNLEIGSGPGRWSQVFANSEYVGIDLDRGAAAYAHSKYCRDIVVGDARMLPFRDDAFDSAFSLGTVEHFPETSRSIREHIRVCRGMVLISVPNLLSPFIISSFVRSIKRLDNGASYQSYFGKRFTSRSFRAVLLASRCEIIQSATFGISLPPKLQKFFSHFNSIFGNELFFVVRKNPAI